ncbi:hypothetical protein ScPMuIL_002920 [Solemya velum]
MSNTLNNIVAGVARGFRDAVLGTFKVYKLDMAIQADIATKSVEPMTTLARRRSEKMKHKKIEKDSEPLLRHRILQCCLLNGGLFWTSILIFNGLILPCLQWLTEIIFGGSADNAVWGWIGLALSMTFNTLWILPLFVLSKIVNCFWFQDIADAAYNKSRGHPQIPSISMFIADMSFSLLLQGLFLIQGMLVNFLPIPGIGQLVGHFHMCVLYSLYAFEYKWFNMGWEVHKRLSHIENIWPYFFGFGLPLAILTALPSSLIVSGCVFSILFPLIIISANEAEEPTESFDFPLKLFAPVVAISNAIFHHSITKRSMVSPSSRTTPVKRTRIAEHDRS